MQESFDVSLTAREVATILAALRLFQVNIETSKIHGFEEYFSEGINPLTLIEIDQLCEKINSHYSGC